MTTPNAPNQFNFLKNTASKKLLLLNCLFAAVYFVFITFGLKRGNLFLFTGLIIGELFHLFQIFGYCYTVWGTKTNNKFDARFSEHVDVFITVCGEPLDIVQETACAAIAMDYPNFEVIILNDGYVANKENWHDIIALAKDLGIRCITRKLPGGAKAGNINNGLKLTESEYFVVFDADHVPHTNFLSQTVGYFIDQKLGFVQTPQFYKNQNENSITMAAWQQQTLFFGPIMSGKNRLNSAFMCGTNMVVRRQAILEAGGMCEFNIAEDFLTSLFIHEKGWKSVYVPKVLAEGLAPEDFMSFYKQQFRWTRGSLEVIFKFNPLFQRGLSVAQKIQYIVSASYYLSGIVVIFDALLPIIFLFTGLTAITTSTMNLALIFVPYMFINLYTLQRTSNFQYSYNAITYSISSCFLQVAALLAVLTNQKTAFAVTSKSKVQGNFLKLTTLHIAYIGLALLGLGIGILREGVSASLLANTAWIVVMVAVFSNFIHASSPTFFKKVKSTEPAMLKQTTKPVNYEYAK